VKGKRRVWGVERGQVLGVVSGHREWSSGKEFAEGERRGWKNVA